MRFAIVVSLLTVGSACLGGPFVGTVTDVLTSFKNADANVRNLQATLNAWDGHVGMLISVERVWSSTDMALVQLTQNLTNAAPFNATDSQKILNFAGSTFTQSLEAFEAALVAKRAPIYESGLAPPISSRLVQTRGNLTAVTNQLNRKVTSAAAATASEIAQKIFTDYDRTQQVFGSNTP